MCNSVLSNIRRFLFICLLFEAIICSDISDKKGLSITIYNNNFAMVKDVRKINFDPSLSYLYFSDVASTIETETVTFKTLNPNATISVYEQNYENNLVGKYSILKKFLGKQVVVLVKFGQQTKNIKGNLLSYEPAFIIQNEDGVNLYDRVEGIQLPNLPEGLLTVPTLVWKVYNPDEQSVSTDCQVAYRAKGFQWKADYSIVLNQKQTDMSFGGWITIDNRSGKKYENAKIKLIAGDVNVNRPKPVYRRGPVAMNASSASSSGFVQKSFSDYHMYTLGRNVDINESSKKQIQFMPKVEQVSIQKFHKLTVNFGGYSQDNIKVENNIRFINSKDNKLGRALPKGTIRVFKGDSDGSLQFLGENTIDHTPKDQNITLSTGKSFDIVAKLIAETRIQQTNGFDADMRLQITNHKEQTQTIELQLFGSYGNNLKLKWFSDQIIEKKNANKYEIKIQIGPNEKRIFKWNEYYRY